MSEIRRPVKSTIKPLAELFPDKKIRPQQKFKTLAPSGSPRTIYDPKNN